MEFTSPTARERFDALVAVADQAIVGLDFDGVLAPIVEDPNEAHIHDDATEVLLELSAVVRAVGVITGRPARQAVALGGLDVLGQAMGEQGRELFVFGQYGNERWSSANNRVISPRPPSGLASFESELPALLARVDALDAYVEEKSLAIAVHTRRLDDPEGAFDRLLEPMQALAASHGLVLEPGRNVLEVRSPGMHKGLAVHTFAAEQSARGFLFAGDDLGDLVAFEAVAELRERGVATLLVCSASDEQSALIPLADVVVPGPDGVMDLLRGLSRSASRTSN